MISGGKKTFFLKIGGFWELFNGISFRIVKLEGIDIMMFGIWLRRINLFREGVATGFKLGRLDSSLVDFKVFLVHFAITLSRNFE